MPTRVLEPADKDQLAQLVLVQKTHFGIPLDPNLASDRLARIQGSLQPESHGRSVLIGHFDSSQKLQAVLGLLFWRSIPYATFHHLIVSPGVKLFFDPEGGFGSCYRLALGYGVERGVTKFFAFCREDHFLIWEKLRARYGQMDERFERRIEARIPAGTLPQFETWKDFCQYQTYEFDTIIFSDYLKPEKARLDHAHS